MAQQFDARGGAGHSARNGRSGTEPEALIHMVPSSFERSAADRAVKRADDRNGDCPSAPCPESNRRLTNDEYCPYLGVKRRMNAEIVRRLGIRPEGADRPGVGSSRERKRLRIQRGHRAGSRALQRGAPEGDSAKPSAEKPGSVEVKSGAGPGRPEAGCSTRRGAARSATHAPGSRARTGVRHRFQNLSGGGCAR